MQQGREGDAGHAERDHEHDVEDAPAATVLHRRRSDRTRNWQGDHRLTHPMKSRLWTGVLLKPRKGNDRLTTSSAGRRPHTIERAGSTPQLVGHTGRWARPRRPKA